MTAPNRKFWIVAGSTMVAYVVGSSWYDAYRVPRWYQAFHRAQLRGVIYRVTVGKGANVNLAVAGDSHTYTFFPTSGRQTRQGYEFGQFATPGDSVRKASNSDTLYLLKNKRAYSFIAEKPR